MEVLALLVGVLLAALGGEWFVRGCVGVAAALRVPAGIIGATVAAFATSSPELVVGVVSASEGNSALALGDATGSSVVNLGVVLGLALLTVPVVLRRPALRRELPAVLVSAVVLGVLASDGSVGRWDAAVLLALFATWATWAALDARRARDATAQVVGNLSASASIRDLVLGAVALVVAGRLVVIGAKWAGNVIGWDDFLTGSILIALATSTPELATTVVSIRRGHAEVGVGAILGSNVFNMAFVVGVAAAIDPIPVRRVEVFVALAFALVATALVVPGRSGRLGRGRGIPLVACYGCYVVALLAVR